MEKKDKLEVAIEAIGVAKTAIMTAQDILSELKSDTQMLTESIKAIAEIEVAVENRKSIELLKKRLNDSGNTK